MTSKSPIRILTLSKPYVAKTYRKKLRDLSADGRFQIGLVCPYQWGDQSFEGQSDPSYETFKLPILFNGKNHFHFYLGLSEVIKTFKPDIFNIEEEHYSLVTLQALALGRRYNAKCLFYTWQNIHKTYPPPFSWIEQYVFKHSAAGITGNMEAQEVLSSKGFSKPMFEIPQMGVDSSQFVPPDYSDDTKRHLRTKLNLDPAKFWISYVGRLVPEKGVDLLIEATKKVANTYRNVALLILGSGPDAARLRRLAQESGVADKITFLSSVASEQVAPILQAMDVLCLPSRTQANWKEQFGRILVEAMAAGTVVVGSNSGEIPHVIGKAGLIFHEGDADALAGALRKLISTPTLWKDLQLSGVERFKSHYSDAVVARKFAEMFCQVFNSN